MNPFRHKNETEINSKSGSNIPNWLIYFLILIAIIVSVVFYLLPFQSEFITKEEVAKVYFADNITQAHTELIEEFNQKYKGKIEVIPVDLPTLKFTTNKRKELITRTLRSRNSRIDIFAVDQIWVPRFAKWAEPLHSYFTSKELDEILPQALSTCFYNDSLYAIPFFIDVGILYYRRDLIEKFSNSEEIIEKLKNGILWEELINLKSEILDHDYLYVFQGDAYEGLICNFIEMLGEKVGGINNKETLNVYNSYTIESTQRLVDLIYKHKISPTDVTGFDEGSSFEYALKYDIPFFRGWPTTFKYSNLVSRTTNKLNLLEEAPLPRRSTDNSASTIGGWNFILSRNSFLKEEAITFIKFILSQEMQELNYSSGSYLPIIKSFYHDDKILNEYPKLAEYKHIIENGLHRPSDYNYTKISDILSFYLNKALKKELGVDEALRTAQQQIDLSLNVSYNKNKIWQKNELIK